MEIYGIDHVAIRVRNLDRAIDFYTRVLGLKISAREFQKPGIEFFLDCGPSLIGIIQGDEKEGAHPFNGKGIGADHVSFRVKKDQFDKVHEELRNHQVEIAFMKKREKSWSIYFSDPDGNKLEITAWPQEDI
jgi:catechol 2,3-dioxygenase-like lactoylglutathione lyase family enzyme